MGDSRASILRGRGYGVIAAGLLSVLLALFLVVESADVPILDDPSPWLERGGLFAAFVGVALLVADVVLPVPSSLVMIAHGARFGVMIGTSLSLVGGTGAVLVGFAVGRSGRNTIGRFVSPQGQARAERLLDRWGALAIVMTRPVPLLAETTAMLAGASTIPCRRALIAGFAGSLPLALIYALAGAAIVELRQTALIVLSTLAMAGTFWLTSHWLARIVSREERRVDGISNPESI